MVQLMRQSWLACGGVEQDFVESRPGAIWWETAILPGLEFVVNKLDGKPGVSSAPSAVATTAADEVGDVPVREIEPEEVATAEVGA